MVEKYSRKWGIVNIRPLWLRGGVKVRVLLQSKKFRPLQNVSQMLITPNNVLWKIQTVVATLDSGQLVNGEARLFTRLQDKL